jgi:hypothetical protein
MAGIWLVITGRGSQLMTKTGFTGITSSDSGAGEGSDRPFKRLESREHAANLSSGQTK